jgi:hypothetical protein
MAAERARTAAPIRPPSTLPADEAAVVVDAAAALVVVEARDMLAREITQAAVIYILPPVRSGQRLIRVELAIRASSLV